MCRVVRMIRPLSFLVERVLETGLEPAATPQPRPPITEGDIELVCWMGIDTAP